MDVMIQLEKCSRNPAVAQNTCDPAHRSCNTMLAKSASTTGPETKSRFRARTNTSLKCVAQSALRKTVSNRSDSIRVLAELPNHLAESTEWQIREWCLFECARSLDTLPCCTVHRLSFSRTCFGLFAAAWEPERFFNDGREVRIDVTPIVCKLGDKLFVG